MGGRIMIDIRRSDSNISIIPFLTFLDLSASLHCSLSEMQLSIRCLSGYAHSTVRQT